MAFHFRGDFMTEETFRWRLPYEAPMQLAGFAWFERDRVYNRLPRNFAKPFRDPVEELAAHTAGGQIRFQTDSPRVAVRVKLKGPHNMDHMPATGQCGFDCYAGEPGAQRFCGTSRGDRAREQYESIVMSAPDRRMRAVTLNFPLYQGVEEVLVGLAPEAEILPPPPYRDDRPVIVYGTSITQGGCASRPGMLYTNILSRWSNRPYVNLGFSGNGKGESELAEAIADIPNPGGYVLDYEANAGLDGIKSTLAPFIAILRDAHPKAPILVVSRPRFAGEWLNPEVTAAREQARDFQRDTVDRLQSAGDGNIFFLDGGGLLGEKDWEECTVDGVHPTDLGFLRMAEGLWPVLNTILQNRLLAK